MDTKDNWRVCNCGRRARYTLLDASQILNWSCNKYAVCKTYDELLNEVVDLKCVIIDQIEAMEYTRQYVGYQTLPAIKGWSWYDSEQKARKALGWEYDTSLEEEGK